MRRTAAALGFAGASLGLVSAVIGAPAAASLALSSATALTPFPLVAAGLAFQFFVPALAMAGLTLAGENPRRARSALVLSGFLSPFAGSSFASVFYFAAGILVLPPGGWIAGASPGPAGPGETGISALEWANEAGLIGAGLSLAGSLTAIALAVAPAHVPGNVAVKAAWIWPAVVAAASSVAGAAGVQDIARRGRRGIVLTLAFGAVAAMASATLNARMVHAGSFIGFWPALSSQGLLYAGMIAVEAARRDPTSQASP